ncbi:MAG TPA: glycine betaine ABC transporter substrate-binding protein [Candidatus Baltobacteraceae bacterium]|nr:glycine betaine ABC transporter substrate-binding protein [Candidatus Baltobacteraceae bacterium]
MNRGAALALLGAVPLAASCGARGAARTGSKNFTEELILGELYAQALERAGIAVARRLDLGATPIAMNALLRGDIDVYPEYTGTALLNVLGLAPISDARRAYDTVERAYRERFDLIWLDASPFDDSNALASTRALADRYRLRTLSEVSRAAPRLTLGTVPEFLRREDGLPGLRRRYGGFRFKRIVQLDNGLKYQALAHGDVDVVVAFTTDGEIAAEALIVFEDDKHLFPAYQAAPVARPQALRAFPKLAPALNALAPRLTTVAMRALNLQVDGPLQREPADVAHDFLERVHVA